MFSIDDGFLVSRWLAMKWNGKMTSAKTKTSSFSNVWQSFNMINSLFRLTKNVTAEIATIKLSRNINVIKN